LPGRQWRGAGPVGRFGFATLAGDTAASATVDRGPFKTVANIGERELAVRRLEAAKPEFEAIWKHWKAWAKMEEVA
jgi:hypothetical protein